MASVRQIAKSSKVSVATVSRALNNDASVSPDTRDRVLRAANDAGYVAGGKVGRRATTLIGLAYTYPQEFCPYDAQLLWGVTSGVGERRYDVALLNPWRDKEAGETYTQFFRRRGVRGVILRTDPGSRDACLRIADEGFPAVVVGDRFDDAPHVGRAVCDSAADSRSAVEHLIHLGHRRIGLALHDRPDADHADRHHGYRAALAGAGIDYDEALIVRAGAVAFGGASAFNRFRALPDPATAAYFTDPLLSIGALRRAHTLGLRLPDDFSIVGFDDAEVRYDVWPQMTAVCQDTGTLGLEAAQWLVRHIESGGTSADMGPSGDGPLRLELRTVFEVHETTGPVPTAGANGTTRSTSPRFNPSRFNPSRFTSRESDAVRTD